jgi:hypothetical protein
MLRVDVVVLCLLFFDLAGFKFYNIIEPILGLTELNPRLYP